MRKFFWMALLCLVMMLAGCGGEKSGSKDVAISFAISSPSWERNGLSLNEALEKDGFTADLQFAKTAEEQAAQLERFVARKPMCIVVGAVDSKSIKKVLAEAQKKEIPVIAYDRLVMDSDAVSYYVSYDNVAVGEAQARSLEKALRLKEGGSANIEIFAGDAQDNNSRLFLNGAMKVLTPYVTSGRLSIPSGEAAFSEVYVKDWTAENAQERMKRLIGQHYSGGRELDAVLSPNDTVASGIRAALDESYSGRWPLITGQDADPEGIRAIAEGRQLSTISKPPKAMVAQCLKIVRGIQAGSVDTSTAVQTDNGSKKVPSFLCFPVTIDKDNIEDAMNE